MTTKVAIKLENGFEYNGKKISVDANGYFVCYVNGQTYRSPSIQSLKMKLRHVAKLEAFEAFEVTNEGELRLVKIVDVISYGRGLKMLKTDTNRMLYSVIKKEPGTAKAYAIWRRANNKEEQRQKLERKKLKILEQKFKRVNVYNIYNS